MKRLLYMFLTVALISWTTSQAGETSPWRTWQMQRNFPWNMITSIVPCGKDVWFGGRKLMPGEQDGVAVFDKTTESWRMFLETDGLLAEDINRLVVRNGEVWIGCDGWRPYNQGLYRFNPQTQEAQRFTVDDGLPHWRIKDLAFSADSLWVATHSGAAQYNLADDAWTTYHGGETLLSDFLICVAADEDFVWIGNFEGLDVHARETGQWTSHRAGKSVFSAHVAAIWPTEERVWFSSPPAIITYERADASFNVFKEGADAGTAEVTHIRADGDEVFFGTLVNGLHVWHERDRSWRVYTEKEGLGSDLVYALGVDAHHVWCAGDQGSPISRLDRQTGEWRYFRYRDQMPANFLYTIAREGDWLYAGTMGNGFWKCHVPTEQWHNLNVRLLRPDGGEYVYMGEHSTIQITDIYTLHVHDNTVWLGTNHGLCRYPVNSTRPGFEIIAGPSVAMIALAAWKERIFAGTRNQGLLVYDPAADDWQDIDSGALDRRTVHALLADDQTLWLGTPIGLWRMLDATSPPEPVDTGMPGPVTAILRAYGSLWIGTRDGVAHYNQEEDVWQRINIPTSSVAALHESDGFIWIASTTGVLRYYPDDGSVQHYPAASMRIGSGRISSLTGDDDRIWAGTLGGGLSHALLSDF